MTMVGRNDLSATVAALLFVAAATAATQQPQQPAPPASEPTVAIVGCLMRTDTSANRPGSSYSSTNGSRKAPALANGGAGSGYVLKDAAIAHAASPATAQDAETAGAHLAGLQDFRVIAAVDNLDLGAHVNAQVEIRGHLPASSGGGHPEPRLNIGANAISATAIRTVAKGCPAGL
jgi:hypothetical protein